MEGKDFFANNGGKNMFDMGRIGLNISRLRKDAGLTQMGLADRLGISFQAVSNWERGISMPDIAKLGELSELLNVSIDETWATNGRQNLLKACSWTSLFRI